MNKCAPENDLPATTGAPQLPFAPDAWKMWLKLNKIADLLWETYEQDFLQFCIDETDSRSPDRSYPFD